jgi:nitroreductase
VETWDAIRGQRAIRAFADRPLDAEHLDMIVAAGRRAPSSKNTQRWAFVVCTDREHLRQLVAVGNFAGHVASAAVAIAIVTPDESDPGRREWIMFDAGQVAQNIMLTAWDLGVGSAHAAVHHEAVARELLGYPEGQRCDLLISLGYPADPSLMTRPPAKGGRRSPDELIHRERW